MNWIELLIGTLGGASAVVLVVGYLARNFFENRLKKDFENYKSLQRDRENQKKIEIQEQANIRVIVKKYSKIILISAGDLQDRLWHLCVRQAQSENKVLLAKNDSAPMYGAWPMTKKHYLISTMYLFSRFFCWVEILKSNVRFLEFNEDKKSNEFNYHLKRIERMLAETDLQTYSQAKISTDKQVFQLMQTEIGEQLKIEGEEQCMSFHQFRTHYESIKDTNEGMLQLEALILSSTSEAKSNFSITRLTLVCNALYDLVIFLLAHNQLASTDKIETIKVAMFDEKKYQTQWPSAPNEINEPTTFYGV